MRPSALYRAVHVKASRCCISNRPGHLEAQAWTATTIKLSPFEVGRHAISMTLFVIAMVCLPGIAWSVPTNNTQTYSDWSSTPSASGGYIETRIYNDPTNCPNPNVGVTDPTATWWVWWSWAPILTVGCYRSYEEALQAAVENGQRWSLQSVSDYTTGNYQWKHLLADPSTLWTKLGAKRFPVEPNLGQTPTGGPDAEDSCDAAKSGRPSVGNPIDVATGNKVYAFTDYQCYGNGSLRFRRYYNSQSSWSGPLGSNWTATYLQSIRRFAGSPYVDVVRPTGRVLRFSNASGSWTPPPSVFDRLLQTAQGWELKTTLDETEVYDTAGRLLSITDRRGLQTTLQYDTKNRLSVVRNPFGKTLTFSYDASSRIQMITLPSSETISYGYGSNNNLTSVQFADGKVLQYAYALTSGFVNAMTSVIDELANPVSTFSYGDAEGRITESVQGGSVNRWTASYSGDQVAITSPLDSNARTFSAANFGGARRSSSVAGGLCDWCGAQSSTYSPDGRLQSARDWRTAQVCYTHDTRGLEIARIEGLPSSAACPFTGTLSGDQRKVTTEWHPDFRLPTRTTTMKAQGIVVVVEEMQYDSRGSMILRRITDSATGVQRTWTWTYAYSTVVPGALVQSVEDGPRTDVADITTTNYYPGDDALISRRGQVQSVVNALGHATTFSSWNSHGQPTSTVQPNGLVVDKVYDGRQRLISVNFGSEVWSFSYFDNGLIRKITKPDTTFLAFEYDSAQRLIKISDAAGNTITYTLDVAGNRIREDIRDPVGTLTQTRSRVYSSLNRMVQLVGGTTPATQITTFTYDGNANVTSVTDPNGLVVSQAYDVLNRLTDLTEPGAALTHASFDALDQIISVTDPRGIMTSYGLTALRDFRSVNSPDSGLSTAVLDSAGNAASITDARGKAATATYDPLNRPLSIVHSDYSSTFTYDQGAAGKGRLTQIQDTSGSTSWSWTLQGRLQSRSQTVKVPNSQAVLAFSASYAWSTTGRLSRMTYPSGRYVDYGYGTDGNVSSLAVGGAATIDAMLWRPFGPLRSWKPAGSATSVQRTFDLDGRMTSFPLTRSESRAITYDAGGRISSIKKPGTSSLDQLIFFDNRNRISRYVYPSFTQLWSYDLNGNRTSYTPSSQTYSLVVSSTSNRLLSTTGPSPARTYGYDAAGNVTSDGVRTWSYDGRGRMAQTAPIGSPGSTVSYLFNGLGQRVRKTGPTSLVYTGAVYFVYADDGKLLGEYDNTGTAIREYVYVDDGLIAVLQPASGGATAVFNIYTNQINAPIVVTDTSDAMRWKWGTNPYGEAVPNESPAGLVAFKLPLRFPGQYFDGESGIHHNYFRDYDPNIGRYLQSDPIGVAGGINTYSYVDNDPVSKVDPTGEFGLGGALGAAAFNFGTQFLTNLYLADGDWRRALKCVDFGDVLISGTLGFIGPSFISNVLGGKAGPAGLTAAQNRQIYFTKSLPAGFLLKRGSPPLRMGNNCECQGLSFGNLVGAFSQ